MAVIFRPVSALASRFKREATDLGYRVLKGGVLHRIRDIFLIRAVGNNNSAVATVLEIPTILLGGYGGRNGTTDYYTHAIGVEYGPLLSALMSEKLLLDGLGNPVPYFPDDKMNLRIAEGDGRIVIGVVPEWDEYREALNDSTSLSIYMPSSLSVAVCPALSPEIPSNQPWPRTLVLCRAHGSMGNGTVYRTASGEFVPINVLPGHPAITSTPPKGKASRISGLEISAATLGIQPREELYIAMPPIEWGPLRGIVGAMFLRLHNDNTSVIGHGIKLLGYSIADIGLSEDPEIDRYVPSVSWTANIDVDTIPSADAPDTLSATSQIAAGYVYPGWANTYAVLGERDAEEGVMTTRDPSEYTRLWAPSAGYDVPAESVMMLLEIRSTKNGPTVSVRGYDSPVEPVSFNTEDRPTDAIHWATYVVNITTAGTVSYTKISEFDYARYDTGGANVREQYQAFLGINTSPGEGQTVGSPRLICTKWSEQYENVAAEPDGPAPTFVQGEPAHKEPGQYSSYVRLDDLEFIFLSPDGSETPIQFGLYYPFLYDFAVSAPGGSGAPSDGRVDFGNYVYNPSLQRVGSSYPAPWCEFAPGYLAVVVAPRDSYANLIQPLRVMVIEVETGSSLFVSPVLLNSTRVARLTLTCFEQGTIDTEGQISSFGRLILGVSTLDAGEDRTDGFFTITGLNQISWVAREPSNVAGHYAGNGVVPATLGVTTNIDFVEPTPVP